jgi:hypothetical protein
VSCHREYWVCDAEDGGGGEGGTGYDKRESCLQVHSLGCALKAYKLQKVPPLVKPLCVSLSLWWCCLVLWGRLFQLANM